MRPGSRRQALLAALAGLACTVTSFAQESQHPRHKISAASLYGALAARFPIRVGVPGLVAIDVSAPQLHLLPARNRIGATLQAQPSGPAVESALPGEVDLLFALRYEAALQAIVAQEPEVAGLRLPGLRDAAREGLRALVSSALPQVVDRVVLHRFTPRELELPRTMGFEPSQVVVVDDGVVVEFAPGQPR